MEVHFLSCVGTNTEESLTRQAAAQPTRGCRLLHMCVVSYGHSQAHVSLGRSWIPGVWLTGRSSLAAESGLASADRDIGTGGELMDALGTDSC